MKEKQTEESKASKKQSYDTKFLHISNVITYTQTWKVSLHFLQN